MADQESNTPDTILAAKEDPKVLAPGVICKDCNAVKYCEDTKSKPVGCLYKNRRKPFARR